MNRDVTNQLFSSCNEVSKAHPEMKKKNNSQNFGTVLKYLQNYYKHVCMRIFDHSCKRKISSSYFDAVCMDY